MYKVGKGMTVKLSEFGCYIHGGSSVNDAAWKAPEILSGQLPVLSWIDKETNRK